MIELFEKVTCIFGLRGSGKSALMHSLASQYGPEALIYDSQHEFPPDSTYNIYRPKNRYSIDELFSIIHGMTLKRDPKNPYPRPKIIAIDESNRFFRGSHAALDPRMVDLNDSVRHYPYNIGLVLIARRPTQLHPDVVGLADNVICFQLSGKNDIQYLNDLYVGMGDEVQKLKKYHAILLHDNKLSWIDPIKLDDVWLRHQKTL